MDGTEYHNVLDAIPIEYGYDVVPPLNRINLSPVPPLFQKKE